jgi:hypothetical protein
MQSVFTGRKNISSKKVIQREIDSIRSRQIWEFRQLFSSWIPGHLLDGSARNRIYNLEVIFWAFLNQIFMHGASCSEIVRKVQSWMYHKRRAQPSSNTSAYCQARKRLPLELLKKINNHVIRVSLNSKKRDGRWDSREVKVVDGTGVSMPDTAPSQKAYPQSSQMKTGCGFPQIKLTGLFSLSSGMMLGYAYGKLKVSENTLWKKLWKLLKPGDIVLGDRGFSSYANIAGLLLKNIDSVLRLHQGRERVLKGRSKDYITSWKRPAAKPKNWSLTDWNNLPGVLKLRIIEAPVLRKGFRSQKIYICTTLLDADIYPAEDIAKLYFKRWQVELFFRDIKTTMNMDVLRSKSPRMIKKEMMMYSIAYNLLRGIMQEAADMYKIAVDRISFKATVQQFNQWLWLFMALGLTLKNLRDLKADLYQKLVQKLVPERPGRNEPRAKKRRPKNYNLLTQPRHKMVIDYHRNRTERKNAFFALT